MEMNKEKTIEEIRDDVLISLRKVIPNATLDMKLSKMVSEGIKKGYTLSFEAWNKIECIPGGLWRRTRNGIEMRNCFNVFTVIKLPKQPEQK